MQSAESAKLWQTLAEAPVLGTLEVEVKARPNRTARLAHVTVRAATVTLKPPALAGYHLPDITVNAVLAREDMPPETEALEWQLLTCLPVSTFEQAASVVAWYSVRRCIEVYFHVLKSGSQIERL